MKEISRRDFLRWAAMAGGGTLLAACSPLPEITPIPLSRPVPRSTTEATPTFPPTRVPSPTRVPTRTRTPEPTPTRTPEPTATPEPPKLLETIKVDIPGLIVEKYAVNFNEITSKVPEDYRENAKKWVRWLDHYYEPRDTKNQPSKSKPLVVGDFSPIVCGSSFIDLNTIRPSRGPELFYLDEDSNRVYTDVINDGTWGPGILLGEDDKKILDWRDGVVSQYMDISCNGKILYEAMDRMSFSIKTKFARIIADISRGTKTIVKDINGRSYVSKLTDDGNKLFLAAYSSSSQPEDTDPKRGTYLVDLNNWRVQFHLAVPVYHDNPLLNEDGSLVYLSSKDRYVGFIYNTVKEERVAVNWPGSRDPYRGPYIDSPIASPNLHFIARGRDEPSYSIAYTPEGFFTIILNLDTSKRLGEYDQSINPWRINNEGTLFTSKGVLKFENGTYKLVKTRGGEPIEVLVSKIPIL